MFKHGLQRSRVFGQNDVHAIGTQVVDHQCKYLSVASFMSLIESDSPIYFSEHTGLISFQVHVFGTLHVKMSKCALNLKASSFKTSDRKSGRKPKTPFVIGLTTDNLRLYVLRRNSWNWTVNWYLFISRATSSHKYS